MQLDFLTAIGEKINITMAAEAQARTGHDVYAFDMWTVHEFADKLTPVGVDGVTLIQEYVPARDARVIRCEVLDGKLLYAIALGWALAF